MTGDNEKSRPGLNVDVFGDDEGEKQNPDKNQGAKQLHNCGWPALFASRTKTSLTLHRGRSGGAYHRRCPFDMLVTAESRDSTGDHSDHSVGEHVLMTSDCSPTGAFGSIDWNGELK